MSDIWATGACLLQETKAGLMRGQGSFWVKYPAWGLHVKHTPQGKKRDNIVFDKINSAGLIRANTDAGNDNVSEEQRKSPCVLLLF